MPIHEILVICNGERVQVSNIDKARDLAASMAEETGETANVFWNAVLWETYEP